MEAMVSWSTIVVSVVVIIVVSACEVAAVVLIVPWVTIVMVAWIRRVAWIGWVVRIAGIAGRRIRGVGWVTLVVTGANDERGGCLGQERTVWASVVSVLGAVDRDRELHRMRLRRCGEGEGELPGVSVTSVR
jgi:hypothetical protein